MESDNKKFSIVSNNNSKKIVKASTTSKSASKSKTREKEQIVYNNPNWEYKYIKHGVQVVLVKDTEENYNDIENIHDIINLIKKKSSNIVGFIPKLYHEFLDLTNARIKTFVNEGDLVVYKSKFAPNNNNPKIVKEIYIKSLNDMSVLIAKLDDNSLVLCNQLELVN
jgi:hypothetical protein